MMREEDRDYCHRSDEHGESRCFPRGSGTDAGNRTSERDFHTINGRPGTSGRNQQSSTGRRLCDGALGKDIVNVESVGAGNQIRHFSYM